MNIAAAMPIQSLYTALRELLEERETDLIGRLAKGNANLIEERDSLREQVAEIRECDKCDLCEDHHHA